MQVRIVLVFLIPFMMASCGGGDKHLPSANPPEYDPKKVYTTPAAPSSTPSTPIKPIQPTEFERLRSKLDSFETGQKARGEGKKVPFDPKSLQLFKGATSPCEALSRVAQGLGSTQIFAGNEGAALKKALGPEADGIARRMDEHVAEGLKRSLGPAGANCPILVRPQKKIDFSQAPRLVLTRASSSRPLLFAQTTVPDMSHNDYEVQKSSNRENPPSGWVSYKSMETMTRIGKKPHTEGIREQYEMIIAPKAQRCPDPDGMVDGTFEWSFVMYQATTGPDGATRGVLYRRHVAAELKGKVGDDAKVQHVDFDATVTLQHIGTELALYSHTYGSRGRFTIDQRMMGVPQEFRNITVSDFSAGEAEAKDADVVANLTLIVAYFPGLIYFEAQTEWNKPNTCVEIRFTPATKTKRFVPNESTPVKTELRTKKEQALVPAKFKEAKERPREGNGTVSPREAESRLEAPVTLIYRAPATRVKHSGFWIGAVSRAGVAEAIDGEWELADGGLRLRIANRIQADPQSNKSKMGMAQFDGAVQFDIPLEQFAEGWFRGEVNVVRPMVVRHVRPAANPCSGTGSQTEHWIVAAHVDPKTESMAVRFGFTTSNEQASWTCRGPAGTFTDELYVDLFGILESVNMPTKTGIKKDFNARNHEFLEWLSVEVVEGLD